jgi:hypothetical protein
MGGAIAVAPGPATTARRTGRRVVSTWLRSLAALSCSVRSSTARRCAANSGILRARSAWGLTTRSPGHSGVLRLSPLHRGVEGIRRASPIAQTHHELVGVQIANLAALQAVATRATKLIFACPSIR